MKELRESGATVLLVSHSLETLQFVARRGILLEEGRVVATGSALESINAYETLVFRSEKDRLEHRARSRITSEEANIYSARLYGSDGQTLNELHSGEPFGVEIDLRLNRHLQRPMFSIGIMNAQGILCKWNISQEDGLAEPGPPNRYLVRAWYPITT